MNVQESFHLRKNKKKKIRSFNDLHSNEEIFIFTCLNEIQKFRLFKFSRS